MTRNLKKVCRWTKIVPFSFQKQKVVHFEKYVSVEKMEEEKRKNMLSNGDGERPERFIFHGSYFS